jgi:hypothetical protein
MTPATSPGGPMPAVAISCVLPMRRVPIKLRFRSVSAMTGPERTGRSRRDLAAIFGCRPDDGTRRRARRSWSGSPSGLLG